MTETYESRSKSIHLYNPKEEGPGKYDAHYINAYRKNRKAMEKIINKDCRRDAA